MSILDKPKRNAKVDPEFRSVLDDPAGYTTKQLDNAKNEAKKFAKDIYDNNIKDKLNLQRAKEYFGSKEFSTDLKTASLKAKAEFGTLIGNAKEDIKKQLSDGYKNMKEEVENRIDDAKRQIDDIKKEVQNVKNEAKKLFAEGKNTLDKLRASKNKSFKLSLKEFGSYLKENLGDLLEPAENLIEGAIDKAITDVASIIEKNLNKYFGDGGSQRKITKWTFGQYGIYLDIGGNIFHPSGPIQIQYHEVTDYWNNNFPIRILKIKVSHEYASKIIKAKKVSFGENKSFIPITIGALPTNDQVFQGQPANLGDFLGIIKETDTKHSLEEEVNPDTYDKEKSQVQMSSFTFTLFRESEISFQSANQINIIPSNPKPSELIMYAFDHTNTDAKILMSQIENDTPIGLLPIVNESFIEVLKRIDTEVNLYKSGTMTFFENGVFFLLNTENIQDINVSYDKFETQMWLFIPRKEPANYPLFIERQGTRAWFVSTKPNFVDIKQDASSVFGTDTTYITASGQRYEHKYDVSRNAKTIRKQTDANILMKEKNVIYEFITLTQEGVPITKWTPLSTILTQDAKGEVRIYRICYKEIKITSFGKVETVIKGFRKLVNKS